MANGAGLTGGGHQFGAAGGGQGGVSYELPKLYTQAELDDAIDRDRIVGFMAFTANLDPKAITLVYGTSQHAQSIRRALMKAGY